MSVTPVIWENVGTNSRVEIAKALLYEPVLHRLIRSKPQREPLVARVQRALPCFQQDARGDSRLVPRWIEFLSHSRDFNSAETTGQAVVRQPKGDYCVLEKDIQSETERG